MLCITGMNITISISLHHYFGLSELNEHALNLSINLKGRAVMEIDIAFF